VSSSADYGERRQTPRVDLLTEFQGHLITLDEVVRVLQLGSGGMTVAASVPLSPAHVHDMQLTIGDRAITLKARVVHTRMTVDHADEFTYVSGLAFVDPSPEAVQAIDAFLERAEPRPSEDADDSTG
jgi:hypothetical protein